MFPALPSPHGSDDRGTHTQRQVHVYQDTDVTINMLPAEQKLAIQIKFLTNRPYVIYYYFTDERRATHGKTQASFTHTVFSTTTLIGLH